MKQIFSFTLLCLFSFSLSAAPNLGLENPFEAKFTIDSAHTTDVLIIKFQPLVKQASMAAFIFPMYSRTNKNSEIEGSLLAMLGRKMEKM